MAWTITATIDDRVSIKSLMGEKLVVVKLACVSDASASGTYEITQPIMREIRGSWLYLIKIVPGSGGDAPDAAFDLDIEDKTNAHLIDSDSNTHTATSFIMGHDTLGLMPPIIHDLYVVIGSLGNANTADIYLYCTK